MYESFFQLSKRPFAAAPQVDCYVSTPFCDHALQSTIRCLDRAEGIALVMGPTGTGKSLLCQLVAKHFSDRYQVALLNSARLCTRRALLQNILFELQLPYRNLDEGELRLTLVSHLEPQATGSQGLILIVDEAHTLPARLLEEVRLITNLVRDGQPRIRLMLAGGMAMEERLASPKLEAFQQRLATRSYLQSLTYDETLHYIGRQIYQCGGDANRFFPVEAMDAVYRVTDGVPRLINQLCDHSLVLASQKQIAKMDRRGIEEAWADLQQLPGPWHEDHPKAGKPVEEGVIEFGQLADEASFAVEFDSLDEGVFASTEEPASLTMPVVEMPRIVTLSAEEARANELREEWDMDLVDVPQPKAFTAPLPTPIFAPAVHAMPVAIKPAAKPASAPAVTAPAAKASAVTNNPFGDNFDEEEIILDRYATMQPAPFVHSPKVSSIEGKEIGKKLQSLTQEKPALPVDQNTSAPVFSVFSQNDYTATDYSSDTSDAHDALYSEASAALADVDVVEPDSRPFTNARGVRTYRPLALGEGIDDDRDMIVISEQDPRLEESTTSVPYGRRREYRQLFSTLRQGK